MVGKMGNAKDSHDHGRRLRRRVRLLRFSAQRRKSQLQSLLHRRRERADGDPGGLYRQRVPELREPPHPLLVLGVRGRRFMHPLHPVHQEADDERRQLRAAERGVCWIHGRLDGLRHFVRLLRRAVPYQREKLGRLQASAVADVGCSDSTSSGDFGAIEPMDFLPRIRWTLHFWWANDDLASGDEECSSMRDLGAAVEAELCTYHRDGVVG